jgi:hypothetical protein
MHDPRAAMAGIFLISTLLNVLTVYHYNFKNPMFYGTVAFFWVPYLFNNGMFHPMFILWAALPCLYLLYEIWFKHIEKLQ